MPPPAAPSPTTRSPTTCGQPTRGRTPRIRANARPHTAHARQRAPALRTPANGARSSAARQPSALPFVAPPPRAALATERPARERAQRAPGREPELHDLGPVLRPMGCTCEGKSETKEEARGPRKRGAKTNGEVLDGGHGGRGGPSTPAVLERAAAEGATRSAPCPNPQAARRRSLCGQLTKTHRCAGAPASAKTQSRRTWREEEQMQQPSARGTVKRKNRLGAVGCS